MDERDRREGEEAPRRQEPGEPAWKGRAPGTPGRLWARARERQRRYEVEREHLERRGEPWAYRETGGGYPGYGGTADRERWAPGEGRFGGGYSAWGGRGGGPYPGGRQGPREVPEASRGLRGPRYDEELRAERIGPGAFRRGGPYTGAGGPTGGGRRYH